MKRVRVSLATSVTLFALGSSSVSHAQNMAGEKASAEALFDEGVSLVARGNYLEGCAKFEASEATEPTLGTELHLADCYERAGKTASAWALFKESQSLAHRQNDTSREEVARIRADALARKLSYLMIEMTGAPPPDFVVRRNGHALPLASLGTPIPVDPGPQELTASAPARRTWSTDVEVPNRPGTVNVSIPPLSVIAPRRTADSSAATRADTGQTQRALGIAATSVGTVGMIVGLGLALYAKRENDQSQRYCPTGSSSSCTSQGLDLRQRGSLFGSVSTVTLFASGAVVAGGVLIWSTAPSKPEPHSAERLRWVAQATPDSLQTVLSGTF